MAPAPGRAGRRAGRARSASCWPSRWPTRSRPRSSPCRPRGWSGGWPSGCRTGSARPTRRATACARASRSRPRRGGRRGRRGGHRRGPGRRPWQPERAVWPLLEVIDASVGEEWCAPLGAHVGDAGRGPPVRRGPPPRRAVRLLRHAPAAAAARPGSAVPGRRTAGRPTSPGSPSCGGGCASASAPRPRPSGWTTACAALRADPDVAPLPARLSLFGPTRLPAAHLAVLAALAEHRDVHLWLPHPSPALWAAVVAPPAGPAPQRRSHRRRRPATRCCRSLGRDVRELQLRLAAAAPERVDRHHPAPIARRPRCSGGCRPTCATTARPTAGRAARRRPQRAGARLPRPGPAGRGAARGRARAAGRRPHPGAARRAGDVPGHRDVRAAGLGRLRARPSGRRRATPASGCGSGWPTARCARSTRCSTRWRSCWSSADARVTASQVLDLLGHRAGAAAVRLDDDDLERLRELVVRSGVRWGLDGAHRAPFRLDGFRAEHLVGRARPAAARRRRCRARSTSGWAPRCRSTTSSPATSPGRAARRARRPARGRPRRAVRRAAARPAGSRCSQDGLDALTCVTGADEWQGAQARAELAAAVRAAGPHAATVALGLADVRGLLAERLRGRPTRANFRTGTLTVGTLVPMRSVPHRVVCLLGLDDGVFPRAGVPDGDDVLARDPLVGERDPRSEDRQLLLDAICAATEHLVVVHSGADERTGARRPPAVPLGRAARRRRGHRGPGRAASRCVVRHPLQPFDPATSPGARPPGRSASTAPSWPGAVAAAGPKRAAGAVPRRAAAPARPTTGSIALDDLVAFLEHPVKGFLRQRLGLSLFTARGAGHRRAAGRARRARRSGRSATGCCATGWPAAAAGPLPAGRVAPRRAAAGRAGRRRCSPGCSTTSSRSSRRPAVPGAARPATATSTSRCPTARRVVGTVGGLHGQRRCCAWSTPGSPPKQRLRAWVRLLALTAADPASRGGRSRRPRAEAGLAMATARPARPRPRPRAVLAELVALRRAGCASRCRCPPSPATPTPPSVAAARIRARRARRGAAQVDHRRGRRARRRRARAGLGPGRRRRGAARAPGPPGGEPTRFGALALRSVGAAAHGRGRGAAVTVIPCATRTDRCSRPPRSTSAARCPPAPPCWRPAPAPARRSPSPRSPPATSPRATPRWPS